MYFDPRAAKLLKAGEHLLIQGCDGLRLVASESRKTWTYRYRVGKLMKQVRLGHWPRMSVSEAVAAWQAASDSRAKGVDPRASKKLEQQNVRVYTVADLVQDHITGHLEQSRKAAGYNAARRLLERMLEDWPEVSRTPANEITRAQVFAIVDALKSKPSNAQKTRSLCGAAWAQAHDAGKLPDNAPNWWREVLRGKIKSKGKIVGGVHDGRKRRVLSLDEVRELLAWLPNMHQLGQDMTIMYLWTCTRGSEIVSMQPQHVRKEGDVWWWTVPVQLTKNAGRDGATDLRVPLIGRALEVVQRRLESVGRSGYLFEDTKGEPYRQAFFSSYINSLQPNSAKVKARAGDGLVIPVADWSPHDLRRTGRTNLAALGCPQDVAEAILGHMPSGIVGVYNRHNFDAERVEWLGRLDGLLRSAETIGSSQL